MTSDKVIYSSKAPGQKPLAVHFVVGDEWSSSHIERNLALWMVACRPDALGDNAHYWRALEDDGVDVYVDPCTEPAN